MKVNKFITAILVALMFASCSLFQEPNIKNSKVVLRAPANGIKTYAQTLTFYWDEVKDADAYNLRIVSPRFDSISEISLDTNLVKNSFVYTLSPGVYEWGVYAYNSAYTSGTSIFTFTITIDSSNNLSNQKIVLDEPGENANLNYILVKFKWEPLTMATYYTIEVRDSSFNSNSVYESIKTIYDTISFTLVQGKYTWGVQGHNDLTNTVYRTRYLIVDTVAPDNPVITVPENDGDTLSSSPLLIEWEHPGSSLSAIYDSVLVSTDSLFSKPDGYYLGTTSLSVEDLTDGKYFVKIKSIDLAGNKSGFCKMRKFFINKQ